MLAMKFLVFLVEKLHETMSKKSVSPSGDLIDKINLIDLESLQACCNSRSTEPEHGTGMIKR